MNKTDKQRIDEFIIILEESIFQNNISKTEYLRCIIQDAKELIFYGEYKIAIENLLDNLLEENIKYNDMGILNDIQDKDVNKLLKYFNNK